MLLEITSDDIIKLNDSELRDLIALLCEADYRKENLSTRGITWGGDQDAADGGLDVVVRDKFGPPENSYIPRRQTGFQIKKPAMPKSEILKEMRPKGVLRQSIQDLIAAEGSYIIVCSEDNTTDKTLKNRIDAMHKAVKAEDPNGHLHLDFYDRNRIASWVRTHPFMILWIRNRIGKQLKGWRPYENWSNPRAGVDEEYLIDDRLKFHSGTNPHEEGICVEDGIRALRSKLSAVPCASVRIAGLSGVGKTRLVQALFDKRIADNALDISMAFYTDISDSPEPDPKSFAEQLIALRRRAILIVDNCPYELHRKLTETCSIQDSKVSLLTVEYDIREDLPEETSVFRLEPSSDDLIEKIILSRFSHLGQLDAKTIAQFSGGNARVAISLSNTIKNGESVAGLKDEDLFKRLFQQRHDPNESLLISAQVCSLVYSFEGKDTLSDNSELKVLASLAGKNVNELYRDVETLKKRDLVQSRGVWRAVLPHAIANRLAKLAIESIPKKTVVKAFFESGSERLIRSFSRRLSYLHDCSQAVEIVNEWLSPDGFLGKTEGYFNQFGMDIFRNIAPVSPEKTLKMIEHAANGKNGKEFTSRENRYHVVYVGILQQLAYDPELFDRSVKIMCRFAISEDQNENNNSTRDSLKSLFYLDFSGTHATMEQKADVIRNLAASDNIDCQILGADLLETTLDTWGLRSFHDYSFGARSRDFGYQPESEEKYNRWFEIFIGICTELAISDNPIADRIRNILSNRLRGLWTNENRYDLVEKCAGLIHEKKPWNEGWIALCEIIKFDGPNMEGKALERLSKLEAFLKPENLLERARTYALLKRGLSVDLEDLCDDDADYREVYHKTEELGREVAGNSEVLKTLLPELFTPHPTRLWSFGKGLAAGSVDKKGLWETLRSMYEKVEPNKRDTDVFVGYLSGVAVTDKALCNSILDSLLQDELLGVYFPKFQIASRIDRRGIERLNESLDSGFINIESFYELSFTGNHDRISDDDLAVLFKKILKKDSGFNLVLDMLSMRFHDPKNEVPAYSENLLEVGRYILSYCTLDKVYVRKNRLAYGVIRVAEVCLAGKDGIDTAKIMCTNFVKAIIDDLIYIPDHSKLLGVVAKLHPYIFLDSFLGNETIPEYKRKRIFRSTVEYRTNYAGRTNPLNQISDEDILSWCEIEPHKRYNLISSTIQSFRQDDDKDALEWRSVVQYLLEKTPDLVSVFNNITGNFKPVSWSGSRADIMQKRSELLKEWFTHENEKIDSMAKNRYEEFQEEIKAGREWENARRIRIPESFE